MGLGVRRPQDTTTPSVSAFLRSVTQQQQLTSKFRSLPSLFELRLSMVDVVRPLDFQSHSFDRMSAIVSHQSASSSKSSLNLPHDDGMLPSVSAFMFPRSIQFLLKKMKPLRPKEPHKAHKIIPNLSLS